MYKFNLAAQAILVSVFIVIILIIGAIYVGYYIDTITDRPQRLSSIEQMIKEYPELRPTVVEVLSDNILSNNDYTIIYEKYYQVKKDRLKKWN